MNYQILYQSPEEFLSRRGEVVEIYRQAFAAPPYHRTEADAISFSESLIRHVNRKAFRSVVAVNPDTGRIDGMAYGYTSQPGQWWYDVVVRQLSPEFSEEWLTGSFEVVELAVKPPAQGQKLGSRLHDALLSGLPHRRAVLSTMQADTVAARLYQRRGWILLIADFQFPGVARPYQILGLNLETFQQTHALNREQ